MDRPMRVFLGFDCGGSSTRALAMDELGNTVFQGQSGPANLASTPEQRLVQNLARAVEGAPFPSAVCGCFAGLLTDEDRERANAYLAELFPASAVRTEPDYAAALAACEPATDLCVIAGTGSLVCSRHEGRVVKSGGRGFLLGDEGSAFQYGRDALIAFLNSGGRVSVNLRESVKKLFETEDEATIVGRVYRAGPPAPLLAKLAKALAVDARNGEPYATASVERHTSALCGVVAEHAARYAAGRPTLKICLAGGLWQVSPIFRSALDRRLAVALPTIQVQTVRISTPPVVGAAMLAKEMACVD